jgi:hypothetical protein
MRCAQVHPVVSRLCAPTEGTDAPRLIRACAMCAQVHPVVSRLCAPIEGTDAARLADCLGLDAAKYHASSGSSAGGVHDALEDARLASAPMLDCDARFKVCACSRVSGFRAALQGRLGTGEVLCC